jgi:sterol desaturase/sphingolipid hydroxylase (fatty acid hydroxylase superfamily)
VLMMCAVPVLRDVHFYAVHRIIHWGPLYRWVHYLHHNNVNVAPVTGLSMHPVEHMLYFSGVLIHWIVPSHPIHALFHIQHAAITPAQGHAGFERIVIADGVAIQTHDGTPEATERMNERFLTRAKQKAAAEGTV